MEADVQNTFCFTANTFDSFKRTRLQICVMDYSQLALTFRTSASALITSSSHRVRKADPENEAGAVGGSHQAPLEGSHRVALRRLL